MGLSSSRKRGLHSDQHGPYVPRALPRLSFGDRLNCDASLVDKLVEPPADDGIAATVDDERGFNKIGCG